MLAHLITACLLAGQVQEVPVVVVDRDDVQVTQSCNVLIPADTVIRDANRNGVVHIKAAGITVTFVGEFLRGSPKGTDPDQYDGIGVRIVDVAGVTLKDLRVSGFKVGVWASDTDGLVVEKAILRDQFRQRLGSTPQREDASDWLRPHDNDDHEWLKNYGASLYIERCAGVTVRNVVVRDSQNGIILDRVNASKIYDNDASFLSGWGLALWRSNRNAIMRNAFDFCIRGYSHKVYNRGQDSAGILMFEQCSNNIVAENSCTHGGDGIFGFAGSAALNSDEPLGNNDNVFVENDLSYAAAHGLEMTFSFRNHIKQNRFHENAICGIWGGYSQDMWIIRNEFTANGDMAYGLERGGINIEHGFRNRMVMNRFRNNRCGIHLWNDEDKHLVGLPWAKANHKGCRDNLVYRNRFSGDEIGLQLRDAKSTYYIAGAVTNVGTEVQKDDLSEVIEASGSGPEQPRVEVKLIGGSKPTGKRKHLRGRDQIIMGEWGPWDHTSPFVRLQSRNGKQHVWTLHGLTGDPVLGGNLSDGVVTELADAGPNDPDGTRRLLVEATTPGVHPYAITVSAGDFTGKVEGTLLCIEWTVRFFRWTKDPLDDFDGWLAESKSDAALEVKLSDIAFPYKNGGPSQLVLPKKVTAANLPSNRFGTIATTTVPLTKGSWKIRTRSDDGIRVKVDGKTVIDDWTIHGGKSIDAVFDLDEDRDVTIEVLHFENDGAAELSATLERIHG